MPVRLGLRDLRETNSLGIQRYLSGLRETMKPISVHDYFRPLKTFFRWCVDVGLLADNPVRGITVRVPRTLPRVPEDDDVRRLIQACTPTFEGRRNRALVALLADSGLRISEALRLFTPAGRYTYGPDTLFAVCCSRGDLLYLAEGKLATSPSLAVALGGCSGTSVHGPASPRPR